MYFFETGKMDKGTKDFKKFWPVSIISQLYDPLKEVWKFSLLGIYRLKSGGKPKIEARIGEEKKRITLI